MKITIDTVNDHPEDIKKAIQLLAHFVSKERVGSIGERVSNPRVMPNQVNANNFNSASNINANINNTPNVTNQVPNHKEVPDTPPNFGMLMGLMDGNIPDTSTTTNLEERKKENKSPKVTLF